MSEGYATLGRNSCVGKEEFKSHSFYFSCLFLVCSLLLLRTITVDAFSFDVFASLSFPWVSMGPPDSKTMPSVALVKKVVTL